MPTVIEGLWGLVPGSTSAGGTDNVWLGAGPNGLDAA